MFLLTPDYPARRPLRAALREGLTGLRQTLGELPKQKAMATFLLANMIYTDGLVSLFAFGGIYAAGTFGWHTIQIGTFGIILAIAGTFGAWLGGKLDDRLGPKQVILGSMLVLLFAITAILLVDKDSIFLVKVAPPAPGATLFSGAAERAYLVLGCLIGAAGGPLQAASRTLLIRLAPKDRIAQYFGLFALPAVDRRDHGRHRKPEGRHGDAGAVLRRRIGAAGAGVRRPRERGDPYRVIYRGCAAANCCPTTACGYGSLRSQGRQPNAGNALPR